MAQRYASGRFSHARIERYRVKYPGLSDRKPYGPPPIRDRKASGRLVKGAHSLTRSRPADSTLDGPPYGPRSYEDDHGLGWLRAPVKWPPKWPGRGTGSRKDQ